jgi:hypothetical protein
VQPRPDGLEPVIAFLGSFSLAISGPLILLLVPLALWTWRRRPGRAAAAVLAVGLADGAVTAATGPLDGLAWPAAVASHVLAALLLAAVLATAWQAGGRALRWLGLLSDGP